MSLHLIEQAQAAGARLRRICGELDLDVRTVQRWRSVDGGDDRREGPRAPPANSLSDAERVGVIKLVTSAEYRDLSPKQIVPLLAEQGLGVAASYSRPSVSSDNPFSESLFRTMKCASVFPASRFPSLDDARTWVDGFVGWYNNEHRHRAIGFVRPNQRDSGEDVEGLEFRRDVYATARAHRPERWSRETRSWARPTVTRLNLDAETRAMAVA